MQQIPMRLDNTLELSNHFSTKLARLAREGNYAALNRTKAKTLLPYLNNEVKHDQGLPLAFSESNLIELSLYFAGYL